MTTDTTTQLVLLYRAAARSLPHNIKDNLAKITVYIHGGTPKTGTSSIQRALRDNRSYLYKRGILYPQNVLSDEDPKHQWVVNALRSGDATRFIDCFLSCLMESDEKTKTMILSTEGFYYQMPRFRQSGLPILKALSLVFNIKLLLVFRNREAFSESLFRQALVNPPTEPEFGRSISADDFFGLAHVQDIIDYAGRIKEMGVVFGLDNVIVLPYEEDIIKRMIVLIDPNAPGEFKIPEMRTNPSISSTVCRVLQQYNDQLVKAGNRDLFIKLLREIDMQYKSTRMTSLLPASLRKSMLEKHRDGDIWIEQHYPMNGTLTRSMLKRE